MIYSLKFEAEDVMIDPSEGAHWGKNDVMI